MNWQEKMNEKQDSLLSDLISLLRIKSVKDPGSSSASAPMGERVAEALEFMLGKARKDGFRTKNIEGYAGYAEMGPEDAEGYIAVLCHVDVVPASAGWTSPPFEPEIREGKLFGRGAIDDKGPTMAAYYAFSLLKELGLPLKHRVRIIFGTDEESGMSCMAKYLETEPHPITGFAPDADFPIIYAEKGQVNLQLDYQKEDTSAIAGDIQVLSFQSGERANVVPDSAEAVLFGQGLSDAAERFKSYCRKQKLEGSSSIDQDQLTLNVKGQSAHAMEPEKGINAAAHLASFLSSEKLDSRGQGYMEFIAGHLAGDHYGKGLSIDFSDEITGPLTVNPGIFRYGTEEAFIHLNIRCPVKTPYEEMHQNLEETARTHGFRISGLRERLPHHVDKNHPLIKTLQRVYLEETGLEPSLLTTGGNTYARMINNGVAFGALFPGREDKAHQKDEYIIIEDLLKAAAIYVRAIHELANLDY